MKKYKNAKKRCNRCGGFISWDDYPRVNLPVHIDENGHKIGRGFCSDHRNSQRQMQSQSQTITKTIKSVPKQRLAGFKWDAKTKVIVLSVALILIIVIPVSIIIGISNQNNLNNQNTPPDDPSDNIPDYVPDDTPDDTPDDPPSPPPTQPWEIDDSGIGDYIVDGDTLDVDGIDDRIRLADVNTPESGESGYQEAKDYLSNKAYGVLVYVDIDDKGSTSYGRIICMIYVRHNSTYLLNINKAIVVYGYGEITDYTNNEFNPSNWDLYVYYPV